MKSIETINYIFQILRIYLISFIIIFLITNLLFHSILVAVFISLLIYFLIQKYFKYNFEPKINELSLKDIKKKGLITTYQIKTNSWTETIIDNSEAAGYNQLIGKGEMNRNKILHTPSLITLKITVDNKIYSKQIESSKDPTTLRMLLEMNKEVTVYFNRNNFEDRYFDLDFLKK